MNRGWQGQKEKDQRKEWLHICTSSEIKDHFSKGRPLQCTGSNFPNSDQARDIERERGAVACTGVVHIEVGGERFNAASVDLPAVSAYVAHLSENTSTSNRLGKPTKCENTPNMQDMPRKKNLLEKPPGSKSPLSVLGREFQRDRHSSNELDHQPYTTPTKRFRSKRRLCRGGGVVYKLSELERAANLKPPQNTAVLFNQHSFCWGWCADCEVRLATLTDLGWWNFMVHCSNPIDHRANAQRVARSKVYGVLCVCHSIKCLESISQLQSGQSDCTWT